MSITLAKTRLTRAAKLSERLIVGLDTEEAMHRCVLLEDRCGHAVNEITVRAIFCFVYFPVYMRGFLHILHTFTCIYTGLWLPGNTSCLFLIWYQSLGFVSLPHAQLVLDSDPIFSSSD
jgi:hypothetical protein